jgi:pyruvate carboxylase
MAGLCQPRAAFTLVKALEEETGLPIHFHTHDTSGIAAASVLAAIDAGADAVDGAIDAMSGLTSQPNLGSIVEALRHSPRDSGVSAESAFCPAAGSRCGTATPRSRRLLWRVKVYVHGMPGGQF